VGERIVVVGGVELCLEEFGESGRPGVVLIAGAAMSGDWWDDEFCQALADGGFRVVRYDLRDTGRSLTRPLGQADYTGDDLVADLAGVIIQLGIAPAHLVGLSLGGGLAQQLAIAHPELVASLALLSTSLGGPGSEGLPAMEPGFAEGLENAEAPDWSSADAAFRTFVAGEELFAGDIPVDPARIRRISDRVFERSIDLAAAANHWSIASASGSRAELATIVAPTLVVHGTADPLFPIGHGEALAREIPHARLLPVPGMGHQVPPPETWPLVVPALIEHARASELDHSPDPGQQ